jgi:hypothetical protein
MCMGRRGTGAVNEADVDSHGHLLHVGSCDDSGTSPDPGCVIIPTSRFDEDQKHQARAAQVPVQPLHQRHKHGTS